MIRNIIKATLIFVIVISTSSIAQVAMALDLSLDNYSSVDLYQPQWAPYGVHYASKPNLNTLQTPSEFDTQSLNRGKKGFSLRLYSGDGLDDLRTNGYRHNSVNLPEEDPEAYGISIKQHF